MDERKKRKVKFWWKRQNNNMEKYREEITHKEYDWDFIIEGLTLGEAVEGPIKKFLEEKW